MQDLHTPFLENLFIVNNKRGHKFLSVAKVGSTTLKTLTVVDDKKQIREIKSSQDIHDIFGYKENGKTLIKTGSLKAPHYVRVVVYRDPVERVTSWYKDKILSKGKDTRLSDYYVKLDLIGETDHRRIIDFLQFEVSKPHGEWIDEHLRPITKYISDEEVDIVVRLNDMDAYLESIGCESTSIKSGHKNSTKDYEFEFPENIQNEIRRIYKQDIDFINSTTKVWQRDYKFSPKKVNID